MSVVIRVKKPVSDLKRLSGPCKGRGGFWDSIVVFQGIWVGLRSVDTLWEYQPEDCVAAGFEDEA